MQAHRQKGNAIFVDLQNSTYYFYVSPCFQYLTQIYKHINIFYMRVLFLSLILPQIIIAAVPPPTAQSQNSWEPNLLNYKSDNNLAENDGKQALISIPREPLGQNNGQYPQKRLEQKITNKMIENYGQNPISGGNPDKIKSNVFNSTTIINQQLINKDQIPKTRGYIIKINKVQKDIELPPANEKSYDDKSSSQLLNELKNIVENKINPQIEQIKLNKINSVNPPKLNIEIIREPQKLRPIQLFTQQQQLETNNFPLYSILPPQVYSYSYAPRTYYQRYNTLYRPRKASQVINFSAHPQIEIEFPNTYFSAINPSDKYRYLNHKNEPEGATNGFYSNP